MGERIPFRLSTSVRIALSARGWPSDAAAEAAAEAVKINGEDSRVSNEIFEDILSEVARVD